MLKTLSSRNRARRVILAILSALILVYILAPIAWILSSSFQAEAALQQRPPSLVPTSEIFTLDHFSFIFTGEVPETSSVTVQGIYTMQGTNVAPAVVNSLIVAITVTATTITIGLPTAHVFARYRFGGDRALMLGLLATRLLPSISVVVAVFVLFRSLGLLDTRLGLILLYTAVTLPFSVWIFRAYLRNIPPQFEEAARLDGCGYWKTLVRVVMPLAKPGVYAVGILTFMTAYAEFVLATILTQTMNSHTQTVVLARLAGGLDISHGMMAAAAVLAMAPPLLLAIVFRRHVLRGLTARLGL